MSRSSKPNGKYEEIQRLTKEVQEKGIPKFTIDERGALRFQNRLSVLDEKNLKNQILQEAHASQLSMHPGGTKIYQDLKKRFWWSNMKREIA